MATASTGESYFAPAPGGRDSSATVKVHLCVMGPAQAGVLSTNKDLDSSLQLPDPGRCSSTLAKQK